MGRGERAARDAALSVKLAFEPNRAYQEREVNLVLAEFHDDFATLRRELVGHGLLCREGGVYRLVVDPLRPITAG